MSTLPRSSSAPSGDRKLSDRALGNFDVDFRDWDLYAGFLRGQLASPPQRILDVGGGNGRFLDRLLDLYPRARGVMIDSAETMVERNRKHPRKIATVADAHNVRSRVEGTFDLITVNVLLHHLVADTERETRDNAVRCLASLSPLLAEGGRLAVFEQVYDPSHIGPEPGAIIYALTRVRHPWCAAVFRRLGANTAGVGVRFRSRSDWRQLFAQAGLAVRAETPLVQDKIPLFRSIPLNIGYMATHLFVLRRAN